MGIERSVVAVPARLQSSRLPNKVLADIGGKPMIRRVLEQCAKASGLNLVVLCTDSTLLREMAIGWGFQVVLTAEHCSSGSERIHRLPISWWAWPGRKTLRTGIGRHVKPGLPLRLSSTFKVTSPFLILLL